MLRTSPRSSRSLANIVFFDTLLERLAQRAGPDKIQAVLERCLETETQVGRYIQLSLVLEGLMDALGQLLDHAGPLPVRYQGF